MQTNISGMYEECLQCFSRTGFAPAHGMCAFMVYTSQALDCSAGNCLRYALGCMHLRSKPLRFRFSGTPQRCRLGGPAFCALPRSEQLR